jgi:hypothetical protein
MTAVTSVSRALWRPALWLVAMTVLFSVDSATLHYYGEETPRATEWLWVVSGEHERVHFCEAAALTPEGLAAVRQQVRAPGPR